MKLLTLYCIIALHPAIGIPVGATRIEAPRTKQSESQQRLVAAAGKSFQNQDWEDAAKQYEQLTKLNPTSSEHWDKLGASYMRGKKYREAIPAIQRALELGAGFPFNQAYNIACCYGQLKESDHALAWVEKAMSLGWRDLNHMRQDEDLALLRDSPRFQELAAIVDPSRWSRDEGWRYDLKLLHRELNRMHYTLRTRKSPELEAEAAKLDQEIPKLTDPQIEARLARIARMAGDGHTSVGRRGQPSAPIQVFQFEEGYFIAAAAPEHKELAGLQVVAVNGVPVEETTKRLEPIISRDNSQNLKAITCVLMIRPRVLAGVGVGTDLEVIEWTLQDEKGSTRKAVTKAVTGGPTADWVRAGGLIDGQPPLYLRNRQKAYWMEYLPAHKTLYVQYNAVRNDLGLSFENFCKRLFTEVNDPKVERLVLDLRWNGGGNTFLTRPLVHGLIGCDKINQKGKLFVITGRNTFSAAMNCTTLIERHTNATFVGEPTGSSPNFVGETVLVTLPYSRMVASISDLFWETSWPMDHRTWIAPDLYAPPTMKAYRAGVDPAMEAILAWDKP